MFGSQRIVTQQAVSYVRSRATGGLFGRNSSLSQRGIGRDAHHKNDQGPGDVTISNIYSITFLVAKTCSCFVMFFSGIVIHIVWWDLNSDFVCGNQFSSKSRCVFVFCCDRFGLYLYLLMAVQKK